jgi:hypothetical protein
MASILSRKISARFVETNGPNAGDLFLLPNHAGFVVFPV